MQFKKQPLTHVRILGLLLIAMSFISTNSWAQRCMPADVSCVEPVAPPAHDGIERGLEVPPQLFVEVPTEPQSVLASEMQKGAGNVIVPPGTPTWGALAKDFDLPGLSGLGISSNWLTQEDAALAALQLCQQNEGKNCFVDLTYSNNCLGVALDRNGKVYWEMAITNDIAAQTAMQTCSEKSAAFCELVYVACSYPAP